jgi:hypothetical protein
MVLPTGIATDATTQYFFRNLISTHTLASLYDFENEDKVFPAVHHSYRFCLWTGTGRAAPQDRIELAFRLRQVPQIAERRFTLTPEDITRLNPNTRTCPVFDYRRNAEITLGIYRRVPVLWREQPESNPWNLSFMQGIFNMASDSHLFRREDELEADGWTLDGNVFVRDHERMLPLYEAKMVQHFDHRLGTYEGQTQAQANVGTLPRLTPEQKDDPDYAVLPRYWVAESQVDARLARKDWGKGRLVGWRDICRSSDVRTVIAGAIPRIGVGHKFLLALTMHDAACLQANLTAFVLDFCARQKMAGTSMSYMTLKQLPVLPPEAYDKDCPWETGRTLTEWITRRVLELSYTAHDMAEFAADHGETGPPFRWDEERRFAIRAELDAAYFHLYGVDRDDVDYVMDTFRAFRNNDPDRFARTKKAILETYDALTDASRTGEPYRTALDPPPGQGPRHPAGAP